MMRSSHREFAEHAEQGPERGMGNAGEESVCSLLTPFVSFVVKALNTNNGLCGLCVKF